MDIVIFGIGQIAEVAKVYLETFTDDRVVGFTADAEYMKENSFYGLPVVPWDALETVFPPDSVKLLGPLSYQRLNRFRRARHEEGKARGYEFTSFIHPSTHNLAAHIGENSFILENCTLQPFCEIGEGVIIWSGTHLGHHSKVGDFCFLSSQAGISSGVTIETGCFIGGQAGVCNGLTVGAESYLEVGVLAGRDIPPNSVLRHKCDSPKAYSSENLVHRTFI